MKETGVCPKCGGSKVLKVDPMRCNAFPIGFTSLAKLERWFCGSCGFTEEWIQEADLEKAEISHRGKALREFTAKLETYLKK